MLKYLIKICLISFSALLISSYTEEDQQSFFGELKNFLSYQNRTYSTTDVGYKLHEGSYHFNPVAFTQQVRDYSENELIRINNIEIPQYSDLNRLDIEVMEVANFLKDSLESEKIEGYLVKRLRYDFDYAKYDLKKPWYSGMAQGHATIILIHAYLISRDEEYLKVAEQYANLFLVQASFGGVLRMNEFECGFEEYSSPFMKGSILVLNGNNYAIDALFWVSRYSDKILYKEILTKSIISLENNINRYSAFYHSYYDLNGNYANAHYHNLHIEQLKRLIKYNEILKLNHPLYNVRVTLKDWTNYSFFPFFGFFERMLLNRNNMLYVIFFSNVIIITLLYVLFKTIITRLK